MALKRKSKSKAGSLESVLATMSQYEDDYVQGILDDNMDKEFVSSRILDWENSPYLQNEDGSHSNLRMATEITEEGEWMVFPTIIKNKKGDLVQLRQDRESQEAQNYARDTGQFISFGGDMDKAIRFGEGGYKRFWPKQEGGTR